MSGLLLDTNVVVAYLGGNAKLGRRAAAVIEASRGSAVVSAVSIFEIATNAAIGKLPAPADLSGIVVRAGFEPLAVRFSHAERVRDLPLLHRDPFDRLLVAQAQVEELVLLTTDAQLSAYDIDCHIL
ncbi:MAG: type II toxin-antitoxin system VapC family toxin [Patulibacter sp.]